MKRTRRGFFKTLAVSSFAPAFFNCAKASAISNSIGSQRRFHFVQIDVFTSQPLQGNPLSVFTDARGLSDSEMQQVAPISRGKGFLRIPMTGCQHR
jgi:Phenazine biosynthesis-like protein